MSELPSCERRPLVSAEDDPLLSADAAHWPNVAARRAQLTVADMDDIASGRMWGRRETA
ncbi:hypothetical protein [Streptomyces genisteinicus]|uniref:Uncharacterized protein n=1 Tax=Streptomyces genisteinicus TaxID=2768068 RepID=A0A7H0I596_9ACTN|nr:hypothetical protein [Streptomyces genisteinicus]QNP67962.1 hypothetical protein IAG43_33905 [Streptomyces genisteinicus]